MNIRIYENGASYEPTLKFTTWQRRVSTAFERGSRVVSLWIGDADDIKSPRLSIDLSPEQAITIARDLVAEAKRLNRMQAREIERTARNIAKDAQKGGAA